MCHIIRPSFPSPPFRAGTGARPLEAGEVVHTDRALLPIIPGDQRPPAQAGAEAAAARRQHGALGTTGDLAPLDDYDAVAGGGEGGETGGGGGGEGEGHASPRIKVRMYYGKSIRS